MADNTPRQKPMLPTEDTSFFPRGKHTDDVVLGLGLMVSSMTDAELDDAINQFAMLEKMMPTAINDGGSQMLAEYIRIERNNRKRGEK